MVTKFYTIKPNYKKGQMSSYQNICNFENLGFWLFINYGLYSIKNEWNFDTLDEEQKKEYAKLTEKFFVRNDFAR